MRHTLLVLESLKVETSLFRKIKEDFFLKFRQYDLAILQKLRGNILKSYLKNPMVGFNEKQKEMKILALHWQRVLRDSFEPQNSKEFQELNPLIDHD